MLKDRPNKAANLIAKQSSGPLWIILVIRCHTIAQHIRLQPHKCTNFINKRIPKPAASYFNTYTENKLQLRISVCNSGRKTDRGRFTERRSRKSSGLAGNISISLVLHKPFNTYRLPQSHRHVSMFATKLWNLKSVSIELFPWLRSCYMISLWIVSRDFTNVRVIYGYVDIASL